MDFMIQNMQVPREGLHALVREDGALCDQLLEQSEPYLRASGLRIVEDFVGRRAQARRDSHVLSVHHLLSRVHDCEVEGDCNVLLASRRYDFLHGPVYADVGGKDGGVGCITFEFLKKARVK